MKRDYKTILSSIVTVSILTACSGGTTDIAGTIPATIELSSTFTQDDGRVLASQCFQCHGTNGISTNSWDSIAGESNLASEMFEDDSAIMMTQAHGYTTAEINLIEGYLTQLSGNGSDNDD